MKTPMELLKSAAALDQLARDLYVNHQNYLGQPAETWTAIPRHTRHIYLELSARTLRLMSERTTGTAEDALFHLANALARVDVVRNLGPTHGKVIAAVFPKGTIQ